jgi:hypothetical protein
MITAVSFGGGTNSTALLVGLHERGERPDYILFADTGGEFQRTYDHVHEVQAWCRKVGFPEIIVVSNADPEGERHGHLSLENECINNSTLPSLAYGFKGCSAKWKRQPMDRFLRDQDDVKEAWGRGEKVMRLIGIDAGEAHRSAALMDADDPKWEYDRPLIDWDWAREECLEAIERAGLSLPGKSACWFCPAARKHEVLDLAERFPDLFERACAMEDNAAEANSTVRGLGRNYSWKTLVEADRAQLKLFSESPDVACMCFDGDDQD